MKNKKRQHRKNRRHHITNRKASHSIRQRKKKAQRQAKPAGRETSKKLPIRTSRQRESVSHLLKRVLHEAKVFVGIFVVIIIMCVLSAALFFSVTKVSGYGMMPSLRNNDILVVKREKVIKRFDLVLLNNGLGGEIRRVIGLPGEKIEYQNDTLLVNSQPLDEKAIVDKINTYQAQGKAFTEDFSTISIGGDSQIPAGYYLVLGDNRPYTTDSREYGFVSQDEIKGKVVARLLPLEYAEQY